MILGGFSDNLPELTVTVLTVTPTVSVSLTSGTAYWIAIYNDSNSQTGLDFGAGGTNFPASGYVYSSQAGSKPLTTTTYLYEFQVNATPTAVPEPMTLSIFSTAIAGPGLLRRKRG